ncbi:MAG: tetratricopeptide repeat protein, partial [Anaerolineae bacterium]|nr:tetratricopeptide repeat protein [Anaerolineae bacterium]
MTRKLSPGIEPKLFTRPPVLRFNITPPPVGFVGRRAELAELLAHFDHGVLIASAAGDLGEGATALARRLAAELAKDFPDGCLEIDLRGGMSDFVTSLLPAEAQRRLLRPFHPDALLPEEPGELDRLYRETFGNLKVLVLLDNVANATQLRRLLPRQPSAAIVTAGTEFPVSAKLYSLNLHKLRTEDARALLLQIAPECARMPQRLFGKILQYFGGSPLALRIVGTLLRDSGVRTPRPLLARYNAIKKRLTALRTFDANLAVPIALELAYEAMPAEQRPFFEALAVFPAPFTRLAVMAVWNVDAETADMLLVGFVRSNLVMYAPETELYALHDMVSFYAQELMLGQPERTRLVMARYAYYVLAEAARAGDLYNARGSYREEGLWRFHAIWPHLWAAWLRMSGADSSWPHPGNVDRWLCDVVLRVFPMLSRVLPMTEQMVVLERVLESAQRLDRQAEATTLYLMGQIYTAQEEHAQALHCYEQYLKIVYELHDRRAEAEAMMHIGGACGALGNVKRAQESWRHALALFRMIGDPRAAQL